MTDVNYCILWYRYPVCWINKKSIYFCDLILFLYAYVNIQLTENCWMRIVKLNETMNMTHMLLLNI